MAGHSKWANIQHRKRAQDAKKGKVFTKLIREITVAARMGGEDPSANPRLRLVMDKAYAVNMSRDTIERAIKKGAGGLDTDQMQEVRYEGYGPGGIAIMVDCLTDNRNRTVAEVRHAFTKNGGNLGTSGSVGYLFQEKGLLTFAPGQDETVLMDAAIEAGAEDVLTHEDGSMDVLTKPEDFQTIKDQLIQAGLNPVEAEVRFLPENEVDVDQETGEKIQKLIDMLDDLDDVQNVYSNANIGY